MKGFPFSTFLFFLVSTNEVHSFSSSRTFNLRCSRPFTQLFLKEDNIDEAKGRRKFLQAVTVSSSILSQFTFSANAVERAVGAAEKTCREAGDCLQKGDLDGAVGWNWGGKDRCDA
jgi:hypothetical protein